MPEMVFRGGEEVSEAIPQGRKIVLPHFLEGAGQGPCFIGCGDEAVSKSSDRVRIQGLAPCRRGTMEQLTSGFLLKSKQGCAALQRDSGLRPGAIQKLARIFLRVPRLTSPSSIRPCATH